MDMSWLESILYALVSGFTEFLPVSAQAHRSIMLCLLGQDSEFPLLSLFIHIGALSALIFSTRGQLVRLYREYSLRKIPKSRRKRYPDMQCIMDISFAKMATIPLLLGFFLYPKTSVCTGQLNMVALILLLNGLILHIPMYLPHGNKDSRSMSRMDALLVGIGSALAVLPGFSRVGASSSIAVARGADAQQAYKWSLLLSLPALAVLLCFDVYAVIVTDAGGIGAFAVLKCVFGAVAAYLGASAAITFMRSVAQKADFSSFSYYCWGAALFAFILYLI